MAVPKNSAKAIWIAAIDEVSDSTSGEIKPKDRWRNHMSLLELKQAKVRVDEAFERHGWIVTWTLIELKTAGTVKDQIELLTKSARRVRDLDPIEATLVRESSKKLDKNK